MEERSDDERNEIEFSFSSEFLLMREEEEEEETERKKI